MDLAINMLVVAPLPCFSVRFSQAKENMTCCFGDGQRPLIFKSFPTIDETLPCLSVCVEWNQKAISVVRVKLPHRANLACTLDDREMPTCRRSISMLPKQ